MPHLESNTIALVNNAGAGPERMFYFAEDPITDKMVYKVNTESVFEVWQKLVESVPCTNQC